MTKLTEKDARDFQKIAEDIKEISEFVASSYRYGTFDEPEYKKTRRAYQSKLYDYASKLMEMHDKL